MLPDTIQHAISANVTLFKVLGQTFSTIAENSILYVIVRLRFWSGCGKTGVVL